MELSAKLTLDTGPFAAALADALKAVESLAAETGGLSKAVAEAQGRLADMAKQAEEEARAQREAAAAKAEAEKAAKELSAAEKEAAEAAKRAAEERKAAEAAAKQAHEETAKKVASEQAAMSGLSAASAAADGNIAGAAQSALGLGKALKSAGMAAQAIPYIALAAALAAAVVKIVQMRDEARQMRLDEAFDRARKAASNLAEEVDRINSALSRQASLSKALKDVADSSASKDERIALANLERRRQEALRGKSAEERVAIDADFDLQRNAIIRDNAVAGSGRAVAGMEAQKSANEERIGNLRGEAETLKNAVVQALGRAMSASAEGQRLAVNPFRKGDSQSAFAEAERQNGFAAELQKKIDELNAQIEELGNENKVLGESIAAAAKDVELADAEKAAADAAIETSLANAAKEASEAVSAGSGKAGGGGGEGRIASDRLTRIGGYMGGSSPMKTSEDLLRKANEQRAEMMTLMRDRNGGTFG